MAKLTSRQRKNLPKSDFALPGGRFPIPDKSHARNALARAGMASISPADKAKVRAKVHAKFPGIGKGRKEHNPPMDHHFAHRRPRTD